MSRPLALMLLAVGLAGDAAAQATGQPGFSAPVRAFARPELGVVLSFPAGGGTAIQGVYRRSGGAFEVAFVGGLFDPGGPGDALLLAGVEGRRRVINHTADFPLDGALILGVGSAFSGGGTTLFIPVGVSLGRRMTPAGSTVSIIPYVQPTLVIVADNGTRSRIGLGLGADFRLTARFDARVSAGLGDIEGVSLGAVWVP